MYATLTPAYGRDYKNQKSVLSDWKNGKDFILQDFSSRWDGKPINKADFDASEYRGATIRYSNLRKIVTV